MGCLLKCFQPRGKEVTSNRIEDSSIARSNPQISEQKKNASPHGEKENFAHSFPFRDLAIATKHFRESNLIGQGGFGRVYKGRLEAGQVVAIKHLNREGVQGIKEFLMEVLMLIMLRHPNLVTLYGYCTEGDERLLVYEFMPQGSLEDHLFDLSPDKKPLDWNTRIMIALGVARGLTYLHNVASPPVIYRDMKAANILLDNDFNPKLSDFGLARFGPVGDSTHVSTRVMGTYGYCAPDYARSGKLTMKSDVYSFGVLLLELITGRRAYDSSRIGPEQNLMKWARPFLNDRRKFFLLADPALNGCFPPRAFHQMVVVTSMCLQEQPHVRPIIGDVGVAINHVASQPYIPTVDSTTACSSTPSPSSSSSPLKDKASGARPRVRKSRKSSHRE